MLRQIRTCGLAIVMATVALSGFRPLGAAERLFNGPYSGPHLNRVAFPIGGMGAGMYCLEGTGAISHMSVRHRMEFTHEPTTFAALCVLAAGDEPAVARVIEGPIPDWKYFGQAGTGNGGVGTTYGFPRFHEAEFLARFPFATIQLRDQNVPFDVEIVGFSPFTPPDPDPASLPVGALEYRFVNNSTQTRRAVFSFHTRNFLGRGSIGAIENGFVLYAAVGDDRAQQGAFAIFVDGAAAVVDHCWFRGGWWDALTLAWRNVEQGQLVDNPPVPDNAPGASLAVPLTLEPGQEQTIRLLTCWYVPTTSLRYGKRTAGPAFRQTPSHGTAEGQQAVSGFLGKGLINTFDPEGDGPVGTLTSPPIVLNKQYLHFLVGGGDVAGQTCVNLLVDGKVVHTAVGTRGEQLNWCTFDLGEWQGKPGTIQVVDQRTDAWGHILADHFVLSDEPLESLRAGADNRISDDGQRCVLVHDFEGADYGAWTADPPCTTCCPTGNCCPAELPRTYVPWYTTQFQDVQDVARYWRTHYADLRSRSVEFRNAFYDTTLPPEVVEAVAANLTILKSPTVLRQHDGRLWCYEGCSDNAGCCAGSCTHVWNYAQAICHLFPSLARGMRQTELFESQDDAGRQAFRANLPIAPGGGAFDAADGQLGGIMKAYREWRIVGNDTWLRTMWPRIRQGLDYMIAKYDPRHTGLLEEDHHNTYDINYFGPDGHCGSFYLGALAAAVKMGQYLGDDVALYRELLAKGQRRMESELYNGQYFIQIVQKEGLDHNFVVLNPDDQSAAYRSVAETVNAEGPKYQYGNGCLSDGVLGLWIAKVCGIDDELIDPQKVRSHLLAVHRYNLKHDLSTHANPQRPTFAMGNDGGLLLCSWPRGDKPLLPFVYSDEVWTGIEYQVASHLMMLGCVEEGLDIVRTCRLRYSGVRRNPFNEYECGHWYARALSSYGLIQGLTGVRYDRITGKLLVDSKIGDFRSFLCTDTGFGTVEWKDGKLSLTVRRGEIAVAP